MLDIPRIHAVTDDLILAHPEFTSRARGVMHALGPRGAVHLRARYLTAAQIYAIALTVGDARLVAGELPIGASVHSASEAVAAEHDGASWVVAGHVFATTSHAGMPGRGAELVSAIAAQTSLPCIAIGGVRPARVGTLRDAGAYGVAAITGIWGAASAEAAASDYLSHYDGARGQP